MDKRIEFLSPGTFSLNIAADSRRAEFDTKNEIIVTNSIPVNFIFIGDSITHAWELGAYFQSDKGIILNRGIAGDTPFYIAKRFAADVIQLKPKYTVLNVGINETWVLDNYKSVEKSFIDKLRSKIISDIQSILVQGEKNKLKIILCSILPTNLPGHRPGNPTNSIRNQLVYDINEELKLISEIKGLIYIDYHSEMVEADKKTLRSELSDDGIHPHVLGYNIMADILKNTLKEYDITI